MVIYANLRHGVQMFSQISRIPDLIRKFWVRKCGLYAGVYGKLLRPEIHGRFFRFNPPSTRNFHSRGVCEDPPPLWNFRFFFTLVSELLRGSKSFYIWKMDDSQRYNQFFLFRTLLCYLRFILLLIQKKNLYNVWFLPVILINLKYS